MHRHKMENRFSLKGHQRTVLPYCARTQNQFSPDQPFDASYLNMSGIYLNTNCLNIVVTRGRGTHISAQGRKNM